MNRSERVTEVLEHLDKAYGTEVGCYLTHENAWQLIIAVILSAQCTDARVNMVTPTLFKKYKTPKELGSAKLADVEQIIRSIGFYHAKAKNIIGCSKAIDEEYQGRVPDTIEELTRLPGVGRKTANVILGTIYKKPSIVVDTHVKRISKLLGFTKNDDPEKVEYDLMKILPRDHWILYNYHLITLGRTICIARRPKCDECFLNECCPHSKKRARR